MKYSLGFLLLASAVYATPAISATYEDTVLGENETLTVENGQTASNTSALYKAAIVVKNGGEANVSYVGYTDKDINGHTSENPDESYGPITVGSSVMTVEEGGSASNTFVGNTSLLNVSGTANQVNLLLSTGSTGSVANAPKMNVTGNGVVNGLSMGSYSSVTLQDNAVLNSATIGGAEATLIMKSGTVVNSATLTGSKSYIKVEDGATINNLYAAYPWSTGGTANTVRVDLYGNANGAIIGDSTKNGGYANLYAYAGSIVDNLTVNKNGTVIAGGTLGDIVTINTATVNRMGNMTINPYTIVNGLTINSATVNVNGGTDVASTVINSATINAAGIMNLNSATLDYAVVSDSGTLTVVNGVLSDVNVLGSGTLNIYSLAYASDVVLNGSSTLNIYSEGEVENLIVNDYASAVLYTSATIATATLNASGTLEVKGYATVSDVIDNAGGMIIANAGGAVVSSLTLKNNARFDISTDAVVNITNDSDFNAGKKTEKIAGIDHADDWTINNGSTLTVANDGYAENPVVESGGRIVAKSDTSTVKNMTQNTGGMFDFNTSAEVNVVAGSDLNANKVITTNLAGERRADDWTVNSGSILTVDAGHFADNALVEGGGKIVAKESVSTVTNSEIEQHGMFHFSTLADITQVNSCVRNPADCRILQVHNNVADNWNVNAGSTLEIDNQGTGDNDYVFGGTLYVRQGGQSTNMEIVSGLAYIDGISTSNTIKHVTQDEGTLDNPSEGTSTVVYIGRHTFSNTGEAMAQYNDVSGGVVYVDSYGTLQSNTITGGTVHVNIDGGSNSNANVNDTVMSGGTINVYNSAKVNRTEMSGGTINVKSGGNANTTEMSSGTIYVDSGGTLGVSGDAAKGTSMSDGSITVRGTSYNTSVSGGNMNIVGGSYYTANAYDNDISGGNVTINTGGVATRNDISGGNVTVNSAGTATSNTITGGTVVVAGGGTLNNNTLSDEADVTISYNGTANNTTMSGGDFAVDGTANNNTISGGRVVVGETGYISSNVISGSADVTVGGGGWAEDTIMTGGNLKVEGFAESNNVSGGTVLVQNGGGMLNNTFSGANVTVKTSSTIDYNSVTGGNLTVEGSATNNTISGGTVVVQNGGELNNNDLSDNADVTIEAASSASNTTMADGLLSVKGIASATTVNGGKIVATEMGALVDALTMTGDAVFDFGTNAQVVNTSIFGENPTIDDMHIAHNWKVTDGSILRVQSGGAAYDTIVLSGGTLYNAAAAYDTVVNNNGQVNNLSGATLNNLVVNTGGKLNAESGSKIDGDVTIYSGALMSGDYDYSIIFKADDLTVSTLNIVDGINTGFNNSLVSQGGGNQNTLNLGTNSYQISGAGNNGYTTVSGWNKINIADDSVVDLDGNLSLAGSNSYISLGEAALLNVEDTTSANTTINGGFHNNGVINLTKSTEQLSEALGTMSMLSHPLALSDGDTTNDRLTITGDYVASSSAFLRMNVNTTTHTADMLIINGDVSGTTKLLLDFLSTDDSTQDIPLVEALNDNASTAADFTVWRIYHHPYDDWETTYKDNVWYLAANEEEPDPTPPDPTPPDPTPPDPTPPDPTPPDPDPIYPKKVNPEILAYYSLPTAGLEQTSSIFNNIRDKIAATRIARGRDRAGRYNGGVWEEGMRCGVMNNLWVHATYDHAEITDIGEIEADIYGADFGYDVQTDLHNKVGIFGSYRDGTYDLNGKGHKYYSAKGAEIDIKSWDVGMYYRYDYNYVWLQAIAYMGIQDVDISTDDGVSASTDGFEFGVGGELGKTYRLVDDFTLEPSLGVFYTQVSYDDIDDDVGNHVEYDTINRLELEAGAKLEKTFRSQNGSSKVYVKPSVIVQKTMNSSVMIDTVGEEETIDDRVLGKIQIGAKIGLSRSLSTYGHINYKFGDDYEALSGILGLNYAW